MAPLPPSHGVGASFEAASIEFLAIRLGVMLEKRFKDLKLLCRTYGARFDLAAYPHFRLR